MDLQAIYQWAAAKLAVSDLNRRFVTVVPPRTDSDKNAMRIDFDGTTAVARVTLWDSGECEGEAADFATGARLWYEHREFGGEPEAIKYIEDFALRWGAVEEPGAGRA